MPAVNTAEWINAVDAHPDTLDTDLLVAVALANGETSVEGIDPEQADDSVEELLALGFLELVLADGDEYMMELRYP